MLRSFALLFFFTGLLLSCRKDRFTESAAAQLQPGADTLHFDTVFTTFGSTTQVLKIYNNNREGIRLQALRLAGGNASAFRINADGIPGPEVRGLEIAGRDSLYIFVTVTIQPNAAQLPFVVQDSIEIIWNGNRRFVQLEAWGQNARFLRNHRVLGSETFDNQLPYVILDRLTVDTNATLSITEGARLYFHANAPLLVQGTLLVDGGPQDSTRVLFTGNRLDAPYRNYPASWPGIVLTGSSRNNRLTYAVIRNAFRGIVAEDNAAPTLLRLRQCIIDNAFETGLQVGSAQVDAGNLLIRNCGQNLQLLGTRLANFEHCTIVSYSNAFVQHKDPVLLISDQDLQGRNSALNIRFQNSIFWGTDNGLVPDEVRLLRQGNLPVDIRFNDVLWRLRAAPAPATIINALNNQDPRFDSVDTQSPFYSFRLQQGSPALDKGAPASLPTDLDGRPRTVGLRPDLGAYERP